MAKTSFLQWSSTAALNTDIGGINIAEFCPPGNLNDADREQMAQLAAWLATPTFPGNVTVTGKISFGDGSVSAPAMTFASDPDTGIYRVAADRLGVATGGVARQEWGAVTTFFAESSGSIATDLVGRASDNAAYLRIVDNARIALLASIGFNPALGLDMAAVSGSVRITAASGAAHFWRVGSTDKITLVNNELSPISANTISLGSASLYWKDIFTLNAVTVVSDERVKKWRGGLADAELAAAREIGASIGLYQLKEAIAEKGDAARFHVGSKAQQIIAILDAHGLDWRRYGFVCHDEWAAVEATPALPAVKATSEKRDRRGNLVRPADPGRPATPGMTARPAGERYSVRYEELAMFILAGQEQRIAALEARA